MKVRNLAASVRQRLLDLARARGWEFNRVLARYGVERLLYRLGQSPHARQFVLKGAQLFTLWEGEPHRATRDLDLLGFGDNSVARMQLVFAEICGTEVPPDGLKFDGILLQAAIAGTFLARRTPRPTGEVLALTTAFSENPMKQTQWQAFCRQSLHPDSVRSLAEVVERLAKFLLPPLQVPATFTANWPPGGNWN